MLTTFLSAPVGDREFWKEIGDETETATKNMQPLLKGWLKGPIEGTKFPVCHAFRGSANG